MARRLPGLRSTFPRYSSQPKRLFRSSPLSCASFTITAQAITDDAPDQQSRIRASKLAGLGILLDSSSSPFRVWSRYKDLMFSVGHEHVPLHVHQAVLRKCTYSAQTHRSEAAKKITFIDFRKNPHIHEERFQIVIRNIRAAGLEPTLDDYHFILEQFAATGYHTGVISVYQEIGRADLAPRILTFSLCLQAIAHRLSLPVLEARRPLLVKQSIAMCGELLHGMMARKVPFTSVNLDMAIRILKETASMKDFEVFLKLGYGIDLSYPDHPPTDASGAQDASSYHSFSTAALNTTIDILGRLGELSKMVQAFEVLTQPLQHLASALDDDDFGAANPPETQPVVLPHASPNTTTYNLLLKYVSRHGHAVFARHYLKQAVWLDHITDRAIRGLICYGRPFHEIPAPHFTVNRGTVLPVFGLSNRDKNVELMRRVLIYLRRVIKRKKINIEYYTSLRVQRDGTAAPTTGASPSPAILTSMARSPPTSVLDLDLDANNEQTGPLVKMFDLVLHSHRLQKDRRELEVFYDHASEVMSRTLQRVKERLGRRIWAGKDVYLLTSEGGRRVHLSRQKWQMLAHFKEHVAGNERTLPRKQRRRATRRSKASASNEYSTGPG
jgi:hypothetical protein